ncbi:HeH/LEM domain protein [Acinetobacter sp. NRRL B-65365]|uniref:HeH/LEM domain-containing protein n=1 Tax=Acinetobacter sp. NRRL B-65365 TaxID=1785092 RepID=UPI0007A05476|nr:HeH/LEM domain-containing protein [Acinetobacter sp. NRRL B-65365]KYQ84267.1 HeH/LEM domain protein [Acinetobacter sp. NRRL B-65365]
MGLSSFNRARERQMTQEKVNELEEQLAGVKGEFIAFKNDPDAMKARIAELEAGASAGDQNPTGVGDNQPQNDQQTGDDQEQDKPVDYSSLKVDEIKAVLTEKGISFDGVTRKDDLLALIPQESKE